MRKALPLLAAALVVAALLLLVFRDGATPPPVAPAAAPDAVSGPRGPQDLRPGEGATPFELLATGGDEGGGRGALVAGPGVRLPGEAGLEGRVLDRATGAGVAGVQVALYSLPPQGAEFVGRMLRMGKTGDDFSSRALPVASAVSGPGGSFTFRGIRAGTYYADVRGPRHVPDPIERVVLAPSGGGGPVDLFVRSGGRLVGSVVDAAGRPVSGASVHAAHGAAALIPALRSGDYQQRGDTSGADGSFVIGGLPAGAGYEVTAVGPRGGSTHVVGVDVVAGADVEVLVTLGRGGVLNGRLLEQRLDAEGAPTTTPAVGARVVAVPRGLRDLRYIEELFASGVRESGVGGRFSLDGVPSGKVDVLAWAPGLLPARAGAFPSADGATLDVGDLVLRSGLTVSGRVVDSDDRPLEGVQVRWPPLDFQGQFEMSFSPMLAPSIPGFEFPLTDAEGRFTAGPFPGGRGSQLFFMKTGYAEEQQRWEPSEGDAPQEELLVRLTRGGAVEGIVVDAGARKPVPRFTVGGFDRLEGTPGAPGSWNPFGGGQLVEQPQGRFRIDAVRPGSSTLTVSAPGYLTERVAVEVQEGEVTRGVIVNLTKGRTVTGVVVDSAGGPVGGARVALHREGRGGGFNPRGGRRGGDVESAMLAMPVGALPFAIGLGLAESATTDEAGGFTIEGVEAGTWRALATQAEFSCGLSEPFVVVAEEEPAPVEVRMVTGGVLAGRVTDRRGAPVPLVAVLAVSPAEFAGGQTAGGAYQAQTDDDGYYRIEHMTGGSYFVVLTRPDTGLDPMSILATLQFQLVTVPDEGEVRVDLVDRSASATRVHGLVLDGGAPRGGGAVIALGLESEDLLGLDVKVAPVDANGRYEFPGLAEGLYRFSYQGGRMGDVSEDVDVPDRAELRHDIVLPVGTLAGRVVDAGSGLPVASARIQLRAEDRALPGGGLLGMFFPSGTSAETERSDEDGRFRFDRLAEGRYTLWAEAPGWGDAEGLYGPSPEVGLELTAGEVRDGVELELPPSLVIRGLVQDAAGVPISGANVTALARRGGSGGAQGPGGRGGPLAAMGSVRGRTGDDGSFALRGVGEGPYDLTVRSGDYATATVRDVTAASEDLVVVLTAGVPVRARVLTASGGPALGAVATLAPLGGGGPGSGGEVVEGWFSGQGVADSQGMLDLGRRAPGAYLLSVSRAGGGSAERTVDVPETGEVLVEVVLE